MGIVALVMIALGSGLGAVGASSMFLTKHAQKQMEDQAKSPQGKKRWKRKNLAREAREVLERREEIRDRFTVWGWGFVFLGSVLAVWAEFLS